MKFLLYLLVSFSTLLPSFDRPSNFLSVVENRCNWIVNSASTAQTRSDNLKPPFSEIIPSNFFINPPFINSKLINPFLFSSPGHWIQILAVVVVILLVWQTIQFYVSRKLRKQREEIDKLLSLEQERTRIAHDLNDGLGSELFGLKLLGQVALTRKKGTETTNDLETIVKIAKDISEKVSEIIWVTDVNQDSVECFWNYLQKYAHLLLRPKGIPYHFKSLSGKANITLSGERRHYLLNFCKIFIRELINCEEANGTALVFKIENNNLHLYVSPIPSLNWENDTWTTGLRSLHGTLGRSDSDQLMIQIPLNV
jgi:hypothetical protein